MPDMSWYNIFRMKTKTISDDDILSIRRIYENTETTQKELADLFHTSQPHISRIVRGLRRKHVSISANPA